MKISKQLNKLRTWMLRQKNVLREKKQKK